MAEQGAPGIQKQQFENQDGGWIGVVIIDGKGDAVGKSVEPGGRVWLSEREKVLTAEAPQRPEHNPFVAQTRERVNPETGEREEYEVTPLIPVSANRFVPDSERFVPEGRDDPRLGEPVRGPAEEEATEPPPSAQGPESALEAPQPPTRATQAVAGSLTGENAPPAAPKPEPEPAALGGENPEEGAVQEETAAKVDQEVGEETGAAVPPAGVAPEGEYAAAEEVGTPDAPNASVQGPPAPWSPGSS